MKLEQFFKQNFVDSVPCTFDYGNQSVKSLFGPIQRSNAADGEGYEAYERVLQLPDENFETRLVINKYETCVEWWLELSGVGSYDSKIIDRLYYADITSTPEGEYHPNAWKFPLFHWSHGSLAQADDFMPVSQNFAPETKHVLQCGGGRTSSGCMPYFNLQLDEQNGCIFAIGWSGQWRASFERLKNSNRSIHFYTEMDNAHFRVQPGETLVLPKMLAMPWQGRLIDSFNAFRRFIRSDILPKYDGKPLEGYVTLRSWGGITPELHKAKFANMEKNKLNAELYSIDAGWHGDESTPPSDEYYFDQWYKTIGTWKPLPTIYPNGFGELHAACQNLDMNFSLWIEPERMVSWNKIVSEHREYFAGPKLPESSQQPEEWKTPYSMMVNLGYKPARDWITNILSSLIDESCMEVLRIDFNYEPIHFWRCLDSPDRLGISEIKYVNGLYEMLQELLQRHPRLKIDNCASGGRRLDYRMFRFSMPMICRSDYFCGQDHEPDPKQAQTFGLSLWIPAHADSLGSCIGHTPESQDTYRFRSSLCSGIGMTAPWWDMSEEEAGWYRKMISDAKRVRPLMSTDFYPLTGYTLSDLDWMAFQFSDPQKGEGMLMAFRHQKNGTPMYRFQLHGIDANAQYHLEDIDAGVIGTVSGEVLTEGYPVEISEKRACRILFYRLI